MIKPHLKKYVHMYYSWVQFKINYSWRRMLHHYRLHIHVYLKNNYESQIIE